MSHMNLEAVFGLDKLEHEQEKARAEEERAREQELKEILARELPEDLLDDLSDTSSEVSEITEDPISQIVGLPTHHLRVEGLCRSTTPRQQPDSHSHLDEQFFHSSQILVSTPNAPKGAVLAPSSKEPLTDTAPSFQSSISQSAEGEELVRLRILNEARSSEIRSLQFQTQQLQSEYELRVSQLTEEVRTQREDISLSTQQLRDSQTRAGVSQGQLGDLEGKLSQSERQCEALRRENLRMSEELQNALTHLDNCKSQLETLCKADVIDRLREQHLSLIQQSDSEHMAEVCEVREEMDAVTNSYQETIRQMDGDTLEQKQLYVREIERLQGELATNHSLLEQLRVEVSESELRARIGRMEVEMSESRERECELEDEKRHLELMLEGLRERCSEAERGKERMATEREEEAKEWREKASEAEAERKESLEKCRAACLQLHEESCNRLRQKSAQEQLLLKEQHEREKKRLYGEMEGLKQELREKERLDEEMEGLKQELREKEGMFGEMEELKQELREKKRMHGEMEGLKQGLREKERLDGEMEGLKQELREKGERVSALEEAMSEKERLYGEMEGLKEELREKEGMFGEMEGLKQELREKERMHGEMEGLKQGLREKERMFGEMEGLKQGLREKERIHREMEGLKRGLREKERLEGEMEVEVEGLKRGLREKGERVSTLEQALSEKDVELRGKEEELVERERALRETESRGRTDTDSISRQVSEVLEEQVEAREVWQYQNELRNQWHEWRSGAEREKKDLTASHDVVVKKYQREISHLKEHISDLENELSEAISAQKSRDELPKERAEIYNHTLETVRNAFTEVLGTHELMEAIPSLELPLAEYSPTGQAPASEFPSLLSEYLQQALLRVVEALCAEKTAALSSMERISSEQSSRVQQAVTQALQHAKQQYLESFSDLKASLNAKFSEKMAGLNETWGQERVSLSEELDESRETCQLLKKRVRECQQASEVGQKEQVEQLSQLKHKLSATDTDMETWHREKSSLSEELGRSTEACQQLIKRVKDMKVGSEKEKRRHLEELSLLKQQLIETDTLHQEHAALDEELDASKEACRQLKKKLREVEFAAEKEKRRQTDQLSVLQQKLADTDTNGEVWHQERNALRRDLEKSSEACLQLKNRLRECEFASEREKRKQMEQLSVLKQKISDTEVAHKKSVQALRQKFKKQIRETRDMSCQAETADLRYKELFERSLNNLRRETEGLMKKKLAIIEEARRVEFENAKKIVENNDCFFRRCRQVMDSEKKLTIQDYHSSI